MANIMLDLTINFAENTAFRNSYASYIPNLVRVTDFTEEEVKCILLVFYKCLKSRKKKQIDIKILQSFFSLMGIEDPFILEQIMRYLNYDSSKNFIEPESFVKLMHIFTSKDLDTLIYYVFSIYDEDNKGVLSMKSTVNERVREFFKTPDEEENIQLRIDMTDLFARKFDLDRDGFISFREYRTVVTAQPPLLEFLGQCLPLEIKRQSLYLVMNMWNKLAQMEGFTFQTKEKRRQSKSSEPSHSPSFDI